MTQGELFAGIGGFGLAGRWCGIESVFQVEIDPFCQKVLKKNFPNAQLFGDIREFDGSKFAGAIDIISGGFPCQPFSHAGKRKGTDDERHLWPEMLRIIREVQPRWVVGENVRGFVDWSGGLVFEQVLSDLENSGYEAQAFILPAASVNAPHKRERCWIIAYAKQIERGNGTFPRYGTEKVGGIKKKERCENWFGFELVPGIGHTQVGFTSWGISEPVVIRSDDGVSEELDRNRNGMLGNSIHPKVAYQIFESILDYESLQTKDIHPT